MKKNQRIVYTTPDGRCAVIIPTPEALARMSLGEIAAKDVPEGLKWHVTTAGGLPAERTFREAWTHESGEVSVEMGKAREIHMGRIRQRRNERLDMLDREQIRSLSNPEKLAEIEARKQELRDLPASIDLEKLKTPGRLAAFVPKLLSESDSN